jgi:hypothetical protein
VTASGTRLINHCGFLKNKFRKPCLREKIISKQSLYSLKAGAGNDSKSEKLPSLRKIMREPLKVLSETVEEAVFAFPLASENPQKRIIGLSSTPFCRPFSVWVQATSGTRFELDSDICL